MFAPSVYDHNFNVMQQLHGTFAIATLLLGLIKYCSQLAECTRGKCPDSRRPVRCSRVLSTANVAVI